jgi:multiple sugar transport system permease protein
MSVKILRHYALSTVLYLALGAGAAIILLPYIWMVSSSFKPEGQTFTASLEFIPRNPTLDGYVKALHENRVGRELLNSLIVAGGETVCVVTTSVLAGYAFARLRFPGRHAIFLLVLGVMMIPFQVLIIPAFIIVRRLGWIDTFQGLIIPRAVMAFGIFLMRQFFLSIPYELEDAGRIDGCSRLGLLLRIAVPLSGPAIATLTIFAFTNSWNAFLWPLITTTKQAMRTIQVALAALKGGGSGEMADWSVLMATATMASLPTLVPYLMLQRYFTKGIVMTGLKG